MTLPKNQFFNYIGYTMKPKTCYLAAPGFEKQVTSHLKGAYEVHERLILSEEPEQPSFFSLNVWQDPEVISFSSISEAASHLRARGKNWTLYPLMAKRRSALISEKLPFVSTKPLKFPEMPKGSMGSWTLLDENTLLLSKTCSSPFANGEPNFLEDKEGPPSRAYLKLYEALTLLGKHPVKGDKCLEIGASPGGWTWVIKKLEAKCLCVDRAPLRDDLMKSPLINFKKADAFSMTPEKVGKVDWIFSDVICYPDKLLEWVKAWIDSGFCHNFVLTIKLQGQDAQSIGERFREMGGKVVHLFHNKHELTWLLKRNEHNVKF